MQPGTLTSPPPRRGRSAAVAVFLLVVSLSSPACSAELYFVPHLIVPTTLYSYMALAGDVDGDGDLDVVYLAREANEVRWAENLAGDGQQWQVHLVTAAHQWPELLKVADLDGDGDLDAVSAGYDAQLIWSENTGGLPPSFTDHVLATQSKLLAVGDLDGDGDLDVVGGYGEAPVLLENDGRRPPSFPRHDLAVPNVPGGYAEAFSGMDSGDLDGDGDIDLASFLRDCTDPHCSVSSSWAAIWLEHHGDWPPTYTPRTLLPREEHAMPWDVVVEDLDGDGDLDLLTAANAVTELAWHENLGNGQPPTFLTHTLWTRARAGAAADEFSVPEGLDVSGTLDGDTVHSAESLIIADIDADGDFDIVRHARWFENDADAPDHFVVHELATWIRGANLSGGDIDGDGDIDVVTTTRYGAGTGERLLLWYEQRYGDPPTPTPTPRDTDGDGLWDYEESWPRQPGQTHMLLDDTDGDQVDDRAEILWEGTDPLNPDTDGDGFPEGLEFVIPGMSPNRWDDPASYPDADGDWLPAAWDPDDADIDSDDDRFTDGLEVTLGGGLWKVTDPAYHPSQGDVNRDGAITNADALAVQSLFIGNIGPDAPVFGGRGFLYADPSRDGYISNMDALLIQSFFLGNVPVLPWP